MTNAELIALAKKELEAHAGFHYSPTVLEAAINAGELADGTVFATNSDGSKVTYFASGVRLIKDGATIKTMPPSERASDMARVVYAKKRARLGHSFGTPR
jgi:hypothetical protein